jgi:LuxR family transcriptional activator of bioluminescence operon
MDSDTLFLYISKIKKSNQISDLKHIIEDFCFINNIPYYLFAILKNNSTSLVNILTNYPEIELFKEEFNFDAEISHVFSSNSPISWDDLMNINIGYYDNIHFSIPILKCDRNNNGYTIPISNTGKEFCFINIFAPKNNDTSKIIEKALPFIHTFSANIYEQFKKIMNVYKKRKQLTSQELNCLFWLCEGKTSWEISQIISISERTTNFHIKNILIKLQASNRQHAVAISIHEKILLPKYNNLVAEIF